MSNLIKMEFYKLRTSKLFIILLICFAATNIVCAVGGPLLMGAVSDGSVSLKMNLSSAFASPFNLETLTMFTFISVVSFLCLDFNDGYIKNIAGQVSNRSSIITAKYIIVAVHNLIYFIVGALSSLIGGAIIGMVMDSQNIGAGIATFFIKWMLSLAIAAILMFFAIGLRSKSVALILAVMVSLGAFGLIYMGIDTVLKNFLKLKDFALSHYMPDTLINNVNVADNTLVANSIIVAVVFIALFFTLTYITFKNKDIK